MSTTTIRLPKALKTRVKREARRAGTSAHGFILEAIAEKAEVAERRADFHATARRRAAGIEATGKTIAWDDMKRYLLEKVAGGDPRKPVARKHSR